MAEKKPSWLRDLLLIPIIVGIIVALVTFVIPRMFDKDKELSYSINLPNEYLDQDAVGSLKIEVNGVPTSALYDYKVSVWNSGDIPLKKIPIRFVFNIKERDFQIFNVIHKTDPSYEFGKITEEDIDSKSKRFVYELLNPGDKDEITFLCNKWAIMTVHSKSEGLKVNWVKPKKNNWFEYASVLLAVIASFLSLFIKLVAEREQKIFVWLKQLFTTKKE